MTWLQEQADAVYYGTHLQEGAGFYAAVGLINGDNISNILAGGYQAFGYNNIEIDTGRVFMIPGGPMSGDYVLGEAGHTTIYDAEIGDRFGPSVAAADITNDGLEDMIAGASRADPYQREAAGTTYVIYGQTTMPDMVLLRPPSQAEMHIFGARRGPICSDSDLGDCADQAGRDLMGGHINGDGVDDLIISAILCNYGGMQDNGNVYAILGNFKKV